MKRDTILVEACVTSAKEAQAAETLGAHRVELCRDLHTGGLTPFRETLDLVLASVGIPVFTMVRLRPGAFTATGAELDAMCRDVEILSRAGVAGVVFGLLTTDNLIDVPAVQSLVSAAGSLPSTFHKAFDLTPNPDEAMDQLKSAGVARVLTAGGPGSAWEGRDTLRRLSLIGGSRLEVIAGGGVRGDHVADLVAHTGVREVHARLSGIPGITEALKA